VHGHQGSRMSGIISVHQPLKTTQTIGCQTSSVNTIRASPTSDNERVATSGTVFSTSSGSVPSGKSAGCIGFVSHSGNIRLAHRNLPILSLRSVRLAKDHRPNR